MNEIRYRVRRWIFGPPRWSTYTPEDRRRVREMSDLIRETSDPDAPILREWRAAPSGRVYVTRQHDTDGVAQELDFRRYARRSGEVVCIENRDGE